MLVIPQRIITAPNFSSILSSRPLTTLRAHSSFTTDINTHFTAPPHNMSRSAADATRFTATSPHAYAKPTPINRASPSTYSASSTPRSNPNARLNPNAPTPPPPIDPKKGAHGNAPPGETPAEKVARLRQVRLREREAQITTWDRVVIRGRVWADRAHKVTVYSLLGFSSKYTHSAHLLHFLSRPCANNRAYDSRRGGYNRHLYDRHDPAQSPQTLSLLR